MESKKSTFTNSLQKIMTEEEKIYENNEEKNNLTKTVLIFAIILFAYWIILLFVYEKDKKYRTSYTDEDELFKKYNPLIAGCIQGSRDVLARDIIAVILKLIDKKIIKMEILPSAKTNESYTYILSRPTAKEETEMDEIEKYIYHWLFGNKVSIDFAERLKELPKENDANKKFKQLNKMAKAKLNRVGANVSKVPMAVRVFNVMLFFISIIIALIHFEYNKLNIYNPETIKGINIEIIGAFLFCLPMLLGILYIPIYLMICTRHRVNKAIRKFTGQKVVTTTVTIVLIFFVVMLITLLFGESIRFLIIDELLISISLIIMLTDNLMLKNEAVMIEDFSRLNMIKDKLEDDTLFKDRDVEQVTLWEKYLAYAVAFGVADKIIKRIKEINIDDDLEKILESKMIFDDITTGYYNFYANASLDRRFIKGYSRITGEVLSSIRRRRIFWRRLFRRKWPGDFLAVEDSLVEVAEEVAGGAF